MPSPARDEEESQMSLAPAPANVAHDLVSGPVLALDIGGTKLATGVVAADGSVHGLQVAPTKPGDGVEPVINRLLDMGRLSVALAGLGPVAVTGISCGGPLDPTTGVVQHPPHLPGWVEVPIGSLASRAFGAPSVLCNDATAGVIAEHRLGAGRGHATVIYLTVSTGIGGGIVINGQVHNGAAGNGGELGHITVRRGGRLCSCGRRGCIEAYASGPSIAARAREALLLDGNSTLAGLDAPTAADVAAAAAEGDALASRIWAETVDLLGSAVTDLVNVLEPDVVVLGGGVATAGAMLLDPVRDVVAAEAMPPAARAARVVLAELGSLAPLVGAGVVGYDLLAGRGHAMTTDTGARP
jgi:glucokinase